MARDIQMVERVGSPSATAFETAINALLAPLLSHTIGAFEILVTDKLPNSTRLIKGLVDTDTTGASVITNPYQVKAFEGPDDVTVIAYVEAFIAANPTYWFSPVLYRYSDQIPGIPNRSLVFVLLNTDGAEGAANWAPGYIAGGGGGAPSGPAGGDLAGTYPLPTVIEGHITTTGTTTARTLTDRFADVLNILDFGAIGDGTSHPLSAGEAAAYNTQFASVGAQGAYAIVAGDERDYAALQCALWSAAWTGQPVHIPVGTFWLNRIPSLEWSPTPSNSAQPQAPKVSKIYGSGIKSILVGVGIAAGRATVEMIGASNFWAANIEFSDLVIGLDSATSNVGAYCLRVGNAHAGWYMRRVKLLGANGALIKIGSSASYSQICTHWESCVIASNVNWDGTHEAWGIQSAVECYAVQIETGGAFCDNLNFVSCLFWGACNIRAHVAKFDSCIFATPSQRPTGTFGANYNISIYLGRLHCVGCYFEDHFIAIKVQAAGAMVENITLESCWFSGVQNFGGPAADYAISCTESTYRIGSVVIKDCAFRDTGYALASVLLIGCHALLTGNICVGTLHPATPITVAYTSATRIMRQEPDSTGDFDIYRFGQKVRATFDEPIYGNLVVEDDINTQVSLLVENPNAGTSASSVVKAICDGFEIRLAAFGPNRPGAGNTGGLISDLAGSKIGISPGGSKHFEVNDNEVEANYNVDGLYGFVARNTNAGVSARTRVAATNGVATITTIVTGTGHTTPNACYTGTESAHDYALVAQASEVCRLTYLDKIFKLRNYSRVGGVGYEETTGRTVAGTGSQVAIELGGTGSAIIPANVLVAGSGIEVEAAGYLSVASAENLTLTIIIQGVTLFAKVIALGTLTDVGWTLKTKVAVRTAGAVGTLIGQGQIVIDGVTYHCVVTSTKAIDTTATAAVGGAIEHSVSDAGNSFTCTNFTVKVSH